MSDFDELKDSLKKHEGCVSYMYLDTRGNVTVGVGHMLSHCDDAQKLSFIIRQSGVSAVAADVIRDFNAVLACPKAESFTHYAPFTRLDMPAEGIDALLDADIAQMEAGVRSHFVGYDSYPDPAKSALLDMAFNLGVSGLASGFPHLRAAAERHDWETCAKQCERQGIQQERNDWTKQQFERAKAGASRVPANT